MYWHTAILVVVTLLMPHGYAEEVATVCNTKGIYEAMDSIRTFIHEWQSLKNPTAFQLHNIGEKLESIMKSADNMKTDQCSPNQKQQMEFMVMFPVALLAEELEVAEGALKAMDDEDMIEHIISLMCSIDCAYILEFAQKATLPETKIHMYNTLNNLLKYTDLNNTMIDTCVTFIKDLSKHAAEETNETVLTVLKPLLRQAIKTDLILQHHNSEALYAIDKELTSEVMQELITENINTPIKNDDDLELFPLFEIVKCPDNLSLWIEHLELIFNKLKESNKLKSVYSVILLKEIRLLEEKVQEEQKQKLVSIKNELPALVQKVLEGELCLQFEDEKKKYKAFVSNTGEKSAIKFVPKEDGIVTAVTAHMGDDGFTILLDKAEDLEGFFDFPIDVENGVLEVVTPEEYCEVTLNACAPFADMLPKINLTSKHLGTLKKFVKFYIKQNQMCSNEA